MLLSCLLFYTADLSYKNAVEFTQNTHTVRAVLKQTPYFSTENNRYYCEAKILTVNGQKINSNLKLSLAEDHGLRADDEILFDAFIYKTGASVKSVENYYKSDRLYLGCYNLQNLKVTRSNYKGYYYYTEKVKEYITDVLLKNLDTDSAGLMISLISGDKSYLKDEIYQNFQRSGVAHLMAVSGMHLTVWIMFFGAVVFAVVWSLIALVIRLYPIRTEPAAFICSNFHNDTCRLQRFC